MVTDRYLEVIHHPEVGEFISSLHERGITPVGIDNVPGSIPLEGHALPKRACLVFGEESSGLSEEMRRECNEILHITQRGSTRAMNVGHAAAIAMWAWVIQHS